MAEPPSRSARGPRPDGRLAAAQFGYQSLAESAQPVFERAALDEFWQLRPAGEKTRAFAEELIRGVAEHHARLDERIAAALERYTLARIAPVEHAILRIAGWELFFAPDPPPRAVVIDQAIELGRRLGGSDSARFVHGVADRMARGTVDG